MKHYLNIIFLSFVFLSCQAKSTNENVSTSIQQASVESLTAQELKSQKSKTEQQLDSLGMVEVSSVDPSIIVQLMYATENNFMKKVLYGDLTKAYLHPLAAEKLKKAQQLLMEYDSNLTLIVCDAARPVSVQKKMYAAVQNTKYRLYVANPSRTSLHNYGMAVDLTIRKSDGEDMDMGTAVDYFGKEAGINQEEALRKQGLLTSQQIANRKLLRRVMTEAGFQPIRGEWWHFNACSLDEAKRKYRLIY